jgi:quercetin dioxygenase-like cupin family protein
VPWSSTSYDLSVPTTSAPERRTGRDDVRIIDESSAGTEDAVTTAREESWTGGWTADDPIQIGFAWAPKDGGGWQVDPITGLEQRDLGLAEASGGALGVQQLRVAGGTPVEDWRAHDVDFDFLYVLAGSVTLENDEGEVVTLEAGGAACQAPLLRHRLSGFSPDFDAVHITAPATYETFSGRAAVLPARASHDGPRAVYSHETPENYTRGAGPRAYFLYRDLGARQMSGDRIHLHIVRATEPGEGTGWHYHTMAQWFMIVGGHSNIGVEDRPTQPLAVGDAMCVGYGSGQRHNVAPFSGDYAVLEMCVPADYDTIPVDRPEGATL